MSVYMNIRTIEYHFILASVNREARTLPEFREELPEFLSSAQLLRGTKAPKYLWSFGVKCLCLSEIIEQTLP